MNRGNDARLPPLILRTGSSESVAAMFCVGVVSLQLVKSFAIRRTKANMNPPVTTPQITGTDT